MNYSKQGMSRLCTNLCVTLGSSHLIYHPILVTLFMIWDNYCDWLLTQPLIVIG